MAVSLTKGQRISLEKVAPGLTEVFVGLGWDVKVMDTGLDFDLDASVFILGSKVFSAFRSVHIFLTSDEPENREWGRNFTHVYVFADQQSVDYLGIASFRHHQVTDIAGVRIDQIMNTSNQANLNLGQLSNLIANTIAHEIGHTLGLDHSLLPTDVMHDGLEHRIHSLMPPSFHVGQIISMNKAIRQYKS